MNIADILRRFADIVDQQQSPARPDAKLQNPAELEPINVGVAVDTPKNQDVGANDAVMIPPLQLKTELLKKAVGVNNVYDPGETRAAQAHSNQERDMIIVLKKNAGVPTAAVMELSNEEPLDD
jgi:hypothetical protein